MKESEQKAAAKAFAEKWKGKGYEKGETHSFWIELLRTVYGVQNPESFIVFEEQVDLSHKSFIDATIPETHVMIEQKSIGKDLSKAIKQSDGTTLTPYQQAKRYAAELPYSKRPRWIVACNFEEFRVYNMENPQAEPEIIFLKDLAKDYYRLQFLVNAQSRDAKKEMEISLAAGEIVGKLYDALLKQYKDPNNIESLKSLNKLCVRLVFCLYAEDAGIFGKRNMFHDYLKTFREKNVRKALIDLFEVLATPEDQRDPYMDKDLAAFPYVNGGLFEDAKIEIPNFTDEILNLLLQHASTDFDWSGISPTIFGAVFESTLNPETRRAGGMHYTSLENIHKVIDPLFLDELKKELETIKESKQINVKNKKLRDFQAKLASLKFLDPASGSGNFLTETYISLRRLENEALKEQIDIEGGEIVLGELLIQVSIGQFYGIEINDFAVTVAKTALWIAEAQMMEETENIAHVNLDFLPLKSYANIIEGNALMMDWGEVIPNDKVNYIMGNPPFSAGRRMGISQRADMNAVAHDFPGNGELDYVAAWYIVAARYMKGSRICAGFVSTSSITQGEQVILLWKRLFEEYNVQIFHAIRSFKWESESKKQASVHCVIIEFSVGEAFRRKVIEENGLKKEVQFINGYLADAPCVWIEGQKKPICQVPPIANGNKPLDNAICAFTPEEKAEFLKVEPKSAPYFYRYMGSREFINGIERWFLLINRIPPELLTKMPHVIDRLRQIKEYRLSSNSTQTKKLADTPAKFHYENMPEKDFLVIPQTSSGKRRYIPIGFLSPDIMTNNKLQVMKDGGMYEFGILSSNVHNAWLRAVAGRFREDFTYSVSVVYNTFPWPSPTDSQREQIKKTAQGILDARNRHCGASLAAIYFDVAMPSDLLEAHRANDRAVMQAYGFDVKTMTEAACVAELMKLYKELTAKEQ